MTEKKDSGFGFGSKITAEKKDEYKDRERLKWTPWSSINVGDKVQSTLTGSLGVITKKEKLLETIYIDWNNGNQSVQSRSNLKNVVFALEEEE